MRKTVFSTCTLQETRMSKTVLLSYMERNKVIKVPEGVRDVAYLDSEFRRSFSFGGNVHVKVVFQKFDNEWNEFIDLEDDAVLDKKEKLKVVVTPLLITPSPTVDTEVKMEKI